MLSSFAASLKTDRRLFRQEIRASIAHCDGLFRAAILTKIESERLKNGLWTILKRAEFDRHYFDSLSEPDIFSFIEARLFQLINEAAHGIKVGRSRPHQSATALRLWVRDEIETIVESLENLHEVLQSSSQNEIFAAFAQSFLRDEARFREVSLVTNQMPCPKFDPDDEATAEIDFHIIAHELGFKSVLENAIDSANDRDFCVEYVNAAALTALHLANLANAVLSESNDAVFETVRSKAGRIFGHYTALMSLLKGLPVEPAADLNEVCEIVFDTTDTLNASLQAATARLKKQG